MVRVWHLVTLAAYLFAETTAFRIPAVGAARRVWRTGRSIDRVDECHARACRMMVGGNQPDDDGKAKPTSEDPSLGIKAAW